MYLATPPIFSSDPTLSVLSPGTMASEEAIDMEDMSPPAAQLITMDDAVSLDGSTATSTLPRPPAGRPRPQPVAVAPDAEDPLPAAELPRLVHTHDQYVAETRRERGEEREMPQNLNRCILRWG